MWTALAASSLASDALAQHVPLVMPEAPPGAPCLNQDFEHISTNGTWTFRNEVAPPSERGLVWQGRSEEAWGPPRVGPVDISTNSNATSLAHGDATEVYWATVGVIRRARLTADGFARAEEAVVEDSRIGGAGVVQRRLSVARSLDRLMVAYIAGASLLVWFLDDVGTISRQVDLGFGRRDVFVTGSGEGFWGTWTSTRGVEFRCWDPSGETLCRAVLEEGPDSDAFGMAQTVDGLRAVWSDASGDFRAADMSTSGVVVRGPTLITFPEPGVRDVRIDEGGTDIVWTVETPEGTWAVFAGALTETFALESVREVWRGPERVRWPALARGEGERFVAMALDALRPTAFRTAVTYRLGATGEPTTVGSGRPGCRWMASVASGTDHPQLAWISGATASFGVELASVDFDRRAVAPLVPMTITDPWARPRLAVVGSTTYVASVTSEQTSLQIELAASRRTAPTAPIRLGRGQIGGVGGDDPGFSMAGGERYGLVAWRGASDGEPAIVAARVTEGGETTVRTIAKGVPSALDGSANRPPAIASAPDGWLLAWLDARRDLEAPDLRTAFVPYDLREPTVRTLVERPQMRNPSLVRGESSYLLLWNHAADSQTLWARILDTNGATTGDAFRVADAAPVRPVSATWWDDQYLVAWVERCGVRFARIAEGAAESELVGECLRDPNSRATDVVLGGGEHRAIAVVERRPDPNIGSSGYELQALLFDADSEAPDAGMDAGTEAEVPALRTTSGCGCNTEANPMRGVNRSAWAHVLALLFFGRRGPRRRA